MNIKVFYYSKWQKDGKLNRHWEREFDSIEKAKESVKTEKPYQAWFKLENELYFYLEQIGWEHGDQGAQQDQPVAGYVGITGEVCDWNMAEAIIKQSPIPVILAGGISDENVFDAIIKLHPAGVDSCTRTNAVDKEGKPIRFKKDLKKVKRMVEEARRADSVLAESLKKAQ
jgi:phosphoribosylanthranilate isomerase